MNTHNNNESSYQKSSILEKTLVIYNSRKPRFSPKSLTGQKKCYACGQSKIFKFKNVINDDLAGTWQLNKKLRNNFDARESNNCVKCGASLRSSLHAKAIVDIHRGKNNNVSTLEQLIDTPEFKSLFVAEINACGSLHAQLGKLKNLQYSEYVPKDKSIPHQDITNLSYDDNSLDLVLTSETLEHVPDYTSALEEVYRVLKPGRFHIFTVPVILNRKSRTRAILENGRIVSLLEKSFHGCTRNVSTDDYIVCNEFGADFIKVLRNIGFSVRIYYTNVLNYNDPNIVFVTQKKEI